MARTMLIIVALLVATACTGNDASSASPTVAASMTAPSPTAGPTQVGALSIDGSGCTLDIDGPVVAGAVAFAATNDTNGVAAFNIAMLDEGTTFAAFQAHIRKEVRLAEAGKPGLGHPDFAVPLFDVLLEPGDIGALWGPLDPGRYVLSCARTYQEVGELRPVAALGPLEVV